MGKLRAASDLTLMLACLHLCSPGASAWRRLRPAQGSVSMRLGMTRLQQLLAYGLSESEARVYLALLQQPSLGASTLAKVTSVPRSHLYEVLESLQAVGLVDILLVGGARAYRARPLHEYLERRIRDQRHEVEEMEASLDEVRQTFLPTADTAPSTEDAGTFRLLLGRRAVAREVDRLVAEAARSVTILSSDKGAQRVLHHLEAVPDAPDPLRAPVFEVYLPRHAEPGGTHHRLPDRVRRGIRWHDLSIPLLGVVRDEEEAIWVHPSPDNEQLRAGKDVALVSTSSAFLRGYLTLLRAAAGNGPAPPAGPAAGRAWEQN